MTYTLGIDGGATATKWAIRNKSGSFVEGVSAPIDGHIYRPESRARLIEVIQEIKSKAQHAKISAIYAGITGIGDRPESAFAVQEIFQKEFPGARVEIVIDMVLGYRAHFNPSEGIFLYAGTGSIAIYLAENGEIVRAGGWGYLLGDEGAGYWMGREAIRRVVSSLDMKLELDIFEKRILSEIGATNWDGIKAFVYSKERSALAALAKTVIELASVGDEVARDIVLTAAEYLVDLVQQIEIVIGKRDLPIVFGGGISSASELLVDSISRGLGREVVISKLRLANRAAELASY